MGISPTDAGVGGDAGLADAATGTDGSMNGDANSGSSADDDGGTREDLGLAPPPPPVFPDAAAPTSESSASGESGCSCEAADSSGQPALWALLIGLFGVLRRRPRRQC